MPAVQVPGTSLAGCVWLKLHVERDPNFDGWTASCTKVARRATRRDFRKVPSKCRKLCQRAEIHLLTSTLGRSFAQKIIFVAWHRHLETADA